MNEDGFVQDPTQGWSLMPDSPLLSGRGTVWPWIDSVRSVANASTAHGVSDGEPKQAGTSPDVRMMRAAIK